MGRVSEARSNRTLALHALEDRHGWLLAQIEELAEALRTIAARVLELDIDDRAGIAALLELTPRLPLGARHQELLNRLLERLGD